MTRWKLGRSTLYFAKVLRYFGRFRGKKVQKFSSFNEPIKLRLKDKLYFEYTAAKDIFESADACKSSASVST